VKQKNGDIEGKDMLGTVINALAIIIGGIIGKLIGAVIPESMQKTILNGIGLIVVLLGIEMSLGTSNILIVLLSLVIGIVIGELLQIDCAFERVGKKLEEVVLRVFRGSGEIAKGFVTASLLFVIGPMAVMGALENGLLGSYNILAVKSSLDGVTSIIFAASLGIGVIFSAIPVFIYQGAISIFASWAERFLNDLVVLEMTALGGILIIAIGLNILNLAKIKVANMLPGLLVITIVTYFFL